METPNAMLSARRRGVDVHCITASGVFDVAYSLRSVPGGQGVGDPASRDNQGRLRCDWTNRSFCRIGRVADVAQMMRPWTGLGWTGHRTLGLQRKSRGGRSEQPESRLKARRVG